MLNVVICDDQKRQREILKGYFERYETDFGIKFKIRFMESAEVLLQQITPDAKVDLFILDIEMGNINGMTCGETIRRIFPFVPIVFATGHREYAYEAFKIDALDYLLKPITYTAFEAFIKKFEKVRTQIENHEDLRFSIQSKGEMLSIAYSDILYFEKSLRKVKMVLQEDEIEFYMSLNELKAALDFNYFIQCHQSYIVNSNKIVAYKNQLIYLQNRQIGIPVSKANIKSVKEVIYHRLRK